MISVCILTKNAVLTLPNTLKSTASFPEVIVLDNGSTDETCDLAATFPNVKIFKSPFIGFGPLKNAAAQLATHDWILSLDSDEVLSLPLIQELHDLVLNTRVAYRMPRHNYYNGKWIRGCGWDHESIARLYHRHSARFSDAKVHESLIADPVIPLSSPILHTPYRSTTDFLLKMQHYSTLFAEQYQGKRNASFGKALAHAFYAFFRSYCLKRGFLCGSEGLMISIYNANTTFYKYLKLAECNQRDR